MIICLTGMHRSGTSLFSSYLNYCGINMGKDMAAAGHGNKHGHFEDKSFLELHKDILQSNGKHMYCDPGHLIITEDQKQLARTIVQNNYKFRNWGWKDPRTTLFLEFWHNNIPDAKYLFLYRDPMAVIDSLFRRRGERFLFLKPLMAADAWLLYNSKILEFYRKHTDRCIIANINGINRSPENALSIISSWLEYRLDKPYSDIYHPKDISSTPSAITKLYAPIINKFRGLDLHKAYDMLENYAAIPS